MYDYYIVKEDDTLESIANKLAMNLELIKELNNINGEIMPGNVLIVPKKNNKYFDYYIVSKGDTLYKIASENMIDANLLASLNGININDYIYPKQVLLVPKGGTSLYITAVGDTLMEVAKGFNVSVDELINQNDKIYLQAEQLIVFRKN